MLPEQDESRRRKVGQDKMEIDNAFVQACDGHVPEKVRK
jgi:elongation factor P--beta-lysine ligase